MHRDGGRTELGKRARFVGPGGNDRGTGHAVPTVCGISDAPMNVTHDCVIGTWCQEIWKLMVSVPGTTWTRSG